MKNIVMQIWYFCYKVKIIQVTTDGKRRMFWKNKFIFNRSWEAKKAARMKELKNMSKTEEKFKNEKKKEKLKDNVRMKK